MLESMRKAASGWVAKVLMGLLVLSFAVWGISDIFRGFGATTLATVGDTKISAETFQRTLRSQMEAASQRFGRAISLTEAQQFGIPTQVLGQLVSDATYQMIADDMGLGISDDEVREIIFKDPSFAGYDGRFDRARFKLLLQNNGYSEDAFVQERRGLATRLQVVAGLAGGARAPEAMLEMVHDFEREKRVIDAVVLTREVVGDIPPPDDKTATDYYEANKAHYRAPEFRKIAMFEISPENVADANTVSDDEAKSAYESRLSRYTDAEQRRVLQVLFNDTAEAEEFAAKIAAGESFDALIEARGLKAGDIDLGLMTKESLVDPAIAEAAFALELNGVSGVVEGRFGSVIVKVTEIVAEQVKPFDEVKDEIKHDLALSRGESEVLDLHDAIEDARAGGQTFSEIAQKFGLKLRTVEAVSRNGTDPDGKVITDLPASQELLNGAFESDVGIENDPLQTGQSGFLWYEVEGVTPERDRPLEEVRDEVIAAWTDEEVRRQLSRKADEIAEKLKNDGDFSRIAAEYDVALETTAPFTRQEAASGDVENATEAAFAGGVGYVGTAAISEANRIVFVVKDAETPPFFAEEAEAAAFGRQLDVMYAQDLLVPYAEKLQTDLGVRVNQQLLLQLIGNSRS
ncbi:MAG: SurA N-terminal domain-containing protein [Hyphomicrobiales bacterium]|nr:SurA N-terminal domain-containing protein [Hyphomicrobiales bacterium]